MRIYYPFLLVGWVLLNSIVMGVMRVICYRRSQKLCNALRGQNVFFHLSPNLLMAHCFAGVTKIAVFCQKNAQPQYWEVYKIKRIMMVHLAITAIGAILLFYLTVNAEA